MNPPEFVGEFLRGAACNWWEGVRAYMTASQMEMTWANFRRLFINHYIPESYRMSMERELIELKQGGKSVAEYTAKFNELVRYVADSDDAPTEAWKIKKYRFGLRADIAHDVSMQQVPSLGELIQKSYHAESGLEAMRKERFEANQKRRDSGKYKEQLKPRGSPTQEGIKLAIQSYNQLLAKESSSILRWRIGSGDNIRVMHDPWLSGSANRWVSSPQPAGVFQLSVRDLLHENYKAWNIAKVRNLFSKDVAEKILETPLLSSVREDKVVWEEERNGCYSVKSGYKLAMRYLIEDVSRLVLDCWKGEWNVLSIVLCVMRRLRMSFTYSLGVQ
ncbi:hypothetical protein TSUD_290630 [Trifolium subterraneum]|uniref:Retrotransposon gag domain-containing protein n=1 Tax=Trifolium subterraneum TaxID=3900 RepID=A0A2Z6PTU0_TRISU|nr:hypothetical protein TSUD_290630 [Trifolium subterraneum]